MTALHFRVCDNISPSHVLNRLFTIINQLIYFLDWTSCKQSYCFSNSYQIPQTRARCFGKGILTLDFWLKIHKIEVLDSTSLSVLALRNLGRVAYLVENFEKIKFVFLVFKLATDPDAGSLFKCK